MGALPLPLSILECSSVSVDGRRRLRVEDRLFDDSNGNSEEGCQVVDIETASGVQSKSSVCEWIGLNVKDYVLDFALWSVSTLARSIFPAPSPFLARLIWRIMRRAKGMTDDCRRLC